MSRAAVPPPPTRFGPLSGLQRATARSPSSGVAPPATAYPAASARGPVAQRAPAPALPAAPRPIQQKPAHRAPLFQGPLQPRPGRPGIVQRAALAVASGFESESADLDGQIYGIWKNEEYPGKIQKSSLSDDKCLYVGKTARGENYGSRFVEHCKKDGWAPWCVDNGCDYGEDDDKWPYVVRNLWEFKGLTRLDVAVAEQYFLQHYASKGAKLKNDANALSADKFALYKSPKTFTTAKLYQGFKPVDFKKI